MYKLDSPRDRGRGAIAVAINGGGAAASGGWCCDEKLKTHYLG